MNLFCIKSHLYENVDHENIFITFVNIIIRFSFYKSSLVKTFDCFSHHFELLYACIMICHERHGTLLLNGLFHLKTKHPLWKILEF